MNKSRLALAAIIGLWAASTILAAPAANAGWQLMNAKSPMLDRGIPYSTIAAKKKSHGIAGILHLGCIARKTVVEGNLLMSARFTQGGIEMTFRIDDAPVEAHLSQIDSSGQIVQIMGFNGEMLRGAHRFRIQIFPFGTAPLFFDFDLAGVDRALNHLHCPRHP